MRLILLLLRPFFYLLYHQLAWSYDFVAAVVSLGRWKDWVRGVLPFIAGRRVLEIGHGPGHLQVALVKNGYQVFGLDESRFMSRQAGRQLRKADIPINLSRGYAQELPFGEAAFDTVVSTFPSEYIFDPRTLAEVRRVLVPDGRLVLLPLAWITGARPLERLAAWLFRVTGEVPGPPGVVHPELRARFQRAGLEVRKETVQQEGSLLLIFIGIKPGGKRPSDLE